MVREHLIYTHHALSIGITDTRIASQREQHHTLRVARVYADGCVGLASAYGDVPMAALEQQAEAALTIGVPYAPAPTADSTSSGSVDHHTMSGPDLTRFTEDLLGRLRRECPDFIFANRVIQESKQLQLHNDRGMQHTFRSREAGVGLTIRAKGSPNIIDAAVGMEIISPPDPAAITRHVGARLDRWNEVEAPTPGKVQVVFEGLRTLELPFARDLRAQVFHSNTSMFQREHAPLHERFVLYDSLAPRFGNPAFDNEGTLRNDPELRLLDASGVRSVAACKRDALRYDRPVTGNGHGGHTSLPSTAFGHLRLGETCDDLASLIGGQPTLWIDLAAGSDCGPLGDYAVPVAVAWILDEAGQVVGRTGGFTLTGNLFEMFGADYLGTTVTTSSPYSHDGWVGTRMTIAG